MTWSNKSVDSCFPVQVFCVANCDNCSPSVLSDTLLLLIIYLRLLNIFESTGAIHRSSNYTMFSSSIRSWSGFFKMSEVVLNLRREIRERYPRFCGQLLCGRSSQAQWQQDWFIYQNLFPSKVENGLYVDVGAFHPFKLSNTVFFDQCLGSADKFHLASSCWL